MGGNIADVLLGLLITCDIALVAFVARRIVSALDKLADKVHDIDVRVAVMEERIHNGANKNG